MALAATLPRFAVFQSNEYMKYLKYIEDVQPFQEMTGEEIVSPYSKYEIELAKTGNGAYVHIRSCYNNKYWVSRSDSYIIPAADKPEEDQSLPSCTLFQPVSIDSSANTFRFWHVQRSRYVTTEIVDIDYKWYLTIRKGCARDNMRIIDWESLLILPKHVAFKGDNELYLSARTIQILPFLHFTSDDSGDPTVGNEVFITPDGHVRIKNNHFRSFWMRSPKWKWTDSSDWTWADSIWAFSEDSSDSNPDTLFSPVKLGDNIVALRNLGNNNFCSRDTTKEGITDCLIADVPTISKETRLVVKELVISRRIYNVVFRLSGARIYDENILEMATTTGTNTTKESNTIQMRLSYKDKKSYVWNGSISLKLGVSTSIRAGIPIIASGSVSISAEVSGECSWGKTVEKETEVGTTYTATVPPMTSVDMP